MSLPSVLREYGEAFRGDWSMIDGRSVRSEMDQIARWLETDYPGDLIARAELGVCMQGNGHWQSWCSDYDCEEAA